jgi:hypothetical protein
MGSLDGRAIGEFLPFLYRRILQEYGNHPTVSYITQLTVPEGKRQQIRYF